MELYIFIFILLTGLFVFVYRVGKNVIDEIKKSKYYIAKAYLTVITEPEGDDDTTSNWTFTNTLTFPFPPAVGQEVHNAGTSYVVKEVIVTKDRDIKVGFEEQIVRKCVASDAIDHLYQDGWEFYDDKMFSDPLPLRGKK